ncbi:Endonuclease I [Moritella viscosa]|uniref:endonuclease n=1 Tax=Moritella viscosa TaxID=80854 RepID=UPI0005091F2D|nr:endonuclease [Moritella viscosa]CED60060.1 endonuclease I [Moritella viscosa]SHO15085.1 Endonuclease I [Moritella viscosa]SHO23689.1 Endonuclease I [Moritella viscosa]
MKYEILSLSIALCALQGVSAQVNNGDFEQWSGNTPEGWSTIDSGLSVFASSEQTKTGAHSAKIIVNTGTQSNTDFLQSVGVTKGTTYHFSTSIFHTEGKVKARLYVDGYRDYSIPTKTNEWQNISYSYIATASKDIVVGVRFYDIAGFDGSEAVYLDNFQPTESTSIPPTPPASCSDATATFTLVTDNYASETSWVLKNSASDVVFSGSGYNNDTTNIKSMCLVDGDYTFEISDSYGDGICCNSGNGSFKIVSNNKLLISGGEFQKVKTVSFNIGNAEPTLPTKPPVFDTYYKQAEGLTGFPLKSALYNIISNHNSQGYGRIWDLVKVADVDSFYEKDGSILDMYSEKPVTKDNINFTKVVDQCGQYKQEGGCYNREHSFPKSWFGGKVEPMNSDGHHLFATDGFVNSKRSNWPFGEVGRATYTSSNGSKLGTARSGLGYSGAVFEPIDEFKGDFARAYFYMATRYENEIASWEGNSRNANEVLNGTNTTVFEPWLLDMLKRWHKNDPVSQKEVIRNQAVFDFQENRNPFVDHPEFVNAIWGL